MILTRSFSLLFFSLEPQWPPHRTTTRTFSSTSSLVSMNESQWDYKWLRQHYFIICACRLHYVYISYRLTVRLFPSLSVCLCLPFTPALPVNAFHVHVYCVTHCHCVSVWNVTRAFCSFFRGHGGREVMLASPVYRKEM